MWLTPLTAVATVMLNDMAHWSIITSVNSATPAILVLTLVGVALVYAALYALFAKPSTSQGKERKQEVINGFQLAGGILLGFVLMGGLVALRGLPSVLLLLRFKFRSFLREQLPSQRWSSSG
jgi:hypothetical protein